MSDRSAALLSNNFIYSAMAIFALAFLAHAIEVAWSVKTPELTVKKTKLDFSKTERVGRLGSAFMLIATLLLLAGVIFRGISANRVPWGNMYEFSITGALSFSLAYLFFEIWCVFFFYISTIKYKCLVGSIIFPNNTKSFTSTSFQ